MNPARVQTRRSDRPARRERPAAQMCRCLYPSPFRRRISAAVAMCVMRGGLRVISRVLNDLCSMRNWVALLELIVALTMKPSSVLENGLDVPVRTGICRGSESPRLLVQLFFKCQADAKTLPTSIHEASEPSLSLTGMYALINGTYISANHIFRLRLSRGEIRGVK